MNDDVSKSLRFWCRISVTSRKKTVYTGHNSILLWVGCVVGVVCCSSCVSASETLVTNATATGRVTHRDKKVEGLRDVEVNALRAGRVQRLVHGLSQKQVKFMASKIPYRCDCSRNGRGSESSEFLWLADVWNRVDFHSFPWVADKPSYPLPRSWREALHSRV